MREVGREAQHRRNLARLAHRLHHRRDVAFVVAWKELVVVLDAFAAERRGVMDPADVAALAAYQLVEVALGKNRNLRFCHRLTAVGPDFSRAIRWPH
jgi:hypothetical protein